MAVDGFGSSSGFVDWDILQQKLFVIGSMVVFGRQL